ncbi:MAG TPA: hypothetical protein VFE29_00665 [Terriglobia bacterium]|nr:hypothetical protein [Terriglobia bacterium]
MKTFSRETEKTVIDILLTDLDLAMTFLNTADTTQIEENARRNRQHASRAYDQIVATLQAVTLNEEQQALFDDKLSLLRSRLWASNERWSN